MKVKFKLLKDDAKMPVYSHPGDSGADIFSTVLTTIFEGEYAIIPTGISVEVPEGFELQVRPKSGMAANFGVTVLNTPGTIDAGYRGEIKVILINLGDEPYTVAKGAKIAQLVLAPVLRAEFVLTEILIDSSRGEGGFGSTGL